MPEENIWEMRVVLESPNLAFRSSKGSNMQNISVPNMVRWAIFPTPPPESRGLLHTYAVLLPVNDIFIFFLIAANRQDNKKEYYSQQAGLSTTDCTEKFKL